MAKNAANRLAEKKYDKKIKELKIQLAQEAKKYLYPRIPEEIREIVESHKYDEFFNLYNNIRTYTTPDHYYGTNIDIDVSLIGLHVLYNHPYNLFDLTKGTPEYNTITNLNKRIYNMINDKTKFKENTENIILSLGTIKRVKEQIPELLPYFPDEIITNALIPVSLLNTIKEAIAL